MCYQNFELFSPLYPICYKYLFSLLVYNKKIIISKNINIIIIMDFTFIFYSLVQERNLFKHGEIQTAGSSVDRHV